MRTHKYLVIFFKYVPYKQSYIGLLNTQNRISGRQKAMKPCVWIVLSYEYSNFLKLHCKDYESIKEKKDCQKKVFHSLQDISVAQRGKPSYTFVNSIVQSSIGVFLLFFLPDAANSLSHCVITCYMICAMLSAVRQTVNLCSLQKKMNFKMYICLNLKSKH